MKKSEKKLFWQLCDFLNGSLEEDSLCAATPTVLGQLFFNRMQGVAYGVLRGNGMLGQINREFRNSLKAAFEMNVIKNNSFFQCVDMVSKILSTAHVSYAMLKGAVLCRLYPDGYRTANDIDLLVLPENVTKIGMCLENAGFLQGNIRDNVFIPATRQEIIASKFLRGETVPYIKKVDLPWMRYLEVDVNFSLDYKSQRSDTLNLLLSRTETKEIHGLNVMTLSDEDFFIHLCCHLYKEATTLPWVEMKRDMTLYKYADIYFFLSSMDEAPTESMFRRAKQISLEKECAFAILQTGKLFRENNKIAFALASTALQDDPQFLHSVTDPKGRRIFIYDDTDIENRFFEENRRCHLKERIQK